MKPGKSIRLDVALVERRLVSTRSRARDLIGRGFIEVDGMLASKAAAPVTSKTIIRLSENTPCYVSRGGEKLVAALDHFKFVVEARRCLDIGASAGGFTDALLQRGALRITAVDVGHGQLDAALLGRPEVTNLEGTDARQLTTAKIGGQVDAVVIDVSFISMLKVLPFILPLCAPGCWLVGLVKPQFEVGPAHIGKGGIVTSEAARQMALRSILEWFAANPAWMVHGTLLSPLLGGSGNREYLVGAERRD